MNTFQFLMKRKGFCILLLKYLTIKVFLIKMCMMWFKNIQGLGGARNPLWAATVTAWPAVPPRRLSHTSLWGSMSPLLFMGLHQEAKAAVSSWAVKLRQEFLNKIQHLPSVGESDLGKELGWWNLSGMSEVMMARLLHVGSRDPPHTKVCEGQCG